MDAETWDARYAATDRVWSAEPNRFVAAHVADLPAGRAVDIGAGEGRNALWLAAKGWQVEALDYSRVAIDRGRAQDDMGSVRWRVADVLTADLPSGCDLALVSYLQLPRAQMRTLWSRAADTLRPGGTFFLVGHDSRNLEEGVGGPQDPDCLYTADDVLAEIGDRVRPEVAERVDRVTDAGTALDVVVRAVRR